MGLFSRKTKSLKQDNLQSQINNLGNQIEELLEENMQLYLEKGIVDSNGSSPIGATFGLVDEQYDKAMLQKLFMTETWFYIAVNTIAKTISSLPFKLEKKKLIRQNVVQANGETEEVFKETWIDASAEPEATLFSYPNEFQTQMDFWYLLIIDLLSTGDCYIHTLKDQEESGDANLDRLRNAINRARHTDVAQMLRINSAAIEIIPGTDEDSFMDGYKVAIDESDLFFECDEIVHIKLPNPSDPYYGLAPIVPVMKKVLLDRYTDEHHIRFYKQGARLGGVIETTKKLTREQMSRLTKTFEANFTGKRQHHKTLILPEGMKYKEIEVSPVDSALIEFSKTNKEPILSAYNVPPIKVGLLDGATFANALIQNKTFYVDTIIPLTKLIEQSINSSKAILKSSRNLRFRFDFDDVEALQEDYQAKSTAAKGMAESGMTINEVRQHVWNLPPLEGGDVTPALRAPAPNPLSLLNTKPDDTKVDTTNAQNDEPALSDIRPTEGTFEERVIQLVNQAINEGLDLALAIQRASQQALEEGFTPKQEEDKSAEKVPVPFSKEKLDHYSKVMSGEGVSSYMDERQKEYESFMKRLEKFIIKKIGKKAYRLPVGFKVKISLPNQSDLKQFIEQESDRISESLIKAARHGYKNNIPSKTIEFPNDSANAILKKIATRNVRSVAKTSLSQLKNIIASSQADQVSVSELSARIQDAFSNITASKANTIARTETLQAVSIGQDLKTRDFKTNFPKEAEALSRVWVTAQDEKVRGSHANQDGTVVKVGQEFPNGLKYPRDPAGEAGEVINCRCTFIDYLPEDSDDILGLLDDGSNLPE